MAPLREYRTHNWPPEPVKEGEVVFLGGFPEEMRDLLDGGRELSHRSFTITGLLIAVAFMNPDRFTCRYDKSDWETAFAPEDSSPLVIPDFSGMSGCPIFRDASENYTFDLAGFVKEESPEYNLLEATASSNIRADGTLW